METTSRPRWTAFILIGFACTMAPLRAEPLRTTLDSSATISGVVTDTVTGLPIENADVGLLYSTSYGAMGWFLFRKTDHDGKYSFKGVPSVVHGDTVYSVSVSLDDSNELSSYWGKDTWDIKVGAGKVTVVDFELAKRLSLTVTVWEHAGDSKILSNAHVAVDPYGFGRYAYNMDSTGAVETFFLPFQSIGTYDITIANPGFQTRHLVDTLHGIVWQESLKVVLDAEIVPSKQVHGTVKSSDGRSVGHRFVDFICSGAGQTWNLFDESDLDGNYRIQGIPQECSGGKLTFDGDSVNVQLDVNDKRVDLVDKYAFVSIFRNFKNHFPTPIHTGFLGDYDALGRLVRFRKASPAASPASDKRRY